MKEFRWLVAALVLFTTFISIGEAAPARKTGNVLLVMTDGLRWQEVFNGADEALMDRENGNVRDVERLRQAFWRETPAARREALLPFFWSEIARKGQIYGNQRRGSIARLTNGKNFSYPGYSETLCGFPDPRIDSNDPNPNPNVTVLEWLHRKPRFRGKVAAFAAWDVFPAIFNRARAGFPVNAGYEPLTEGVATPRLELLNRLKAETPRYWAGEPYDAITFYTALEYLKARRPRLFYLSLGETDEWAHAGRYDEYLVAAQRVARYLGTLWETVQALPQYRGKTTLIVATDHGRGDAPTGWRNHGANVNGSENVWLAFLGPDTPALGERSATAPVTQSQVAATLAAFLGEDYCAAVPRAGRPIAEALGGGGSVLAPGR
jgi:hypothetical protein